MAKVVMFMRSEMFSGERERNEEFRKKVNEVLKKMGKDGFTIKEYNVNTPFGYNMAFEENEDCELVFTTENDTEAQCQASTRGIPVMEWHCFTDDTVSLVYVDKDMSDETISYSISRTH